MRPQQLKKIITIIVLLFISFLLSYGSVSYLENVYQTQFERSQPTTTMIISPDVGYFNNSYSVLPGYFQSISDVYLCFYSKYGNFFNEIKIEVSIDNNEWLEVPLIKRESISTGDNDLILIGRIVVDKPTKYYIYTKYLTPPQTLNLPKGVTLEDASKSVNIYVLNHLDFTPRDRVLEFLVGITLFSAFFSILRFLKDEWSGARDLKSEKLSKKRR